MCTLILLHRCFAEAPLLVGANRDEYLDRPAQGPSVRALGARRLLAPRDLEAGGTWLGMNDAGVFAALTNRPVADPDRSRRSRGLLVEDALRSASVREAAEALVRLPTDAYNSFNLLVADRDEAWVAVYEGRAQVTRLAPGPHVIGNANPDSLASPKVARLLGEVEKLAVGRADAALDALGAVCRAHDRGATPLEDTCIHTPRYGTRSSTLLRMGSNGTDDVLLYADGAPCRTEYEDLTPLLGELDRKAGLAQGFERRNVA